MAFFGAIGGLLGKKGKDSGMSDTSKPFHTHGKEQNSSNSTVSTSSVDASSVDTSSDVASSGGLASLAGSRIRGDVSRVEGNNFVSDQAQTLGAGLFEGQQMVEQRDEIKNARSIPSNLPGGRPENSSQFGDMFMNSPIALTTPLNQSGNLYAVNKEKTGTSKDTLHFGTNYTFKEGNILGVKTKHGVSEEFDKDATYVSGRGKGYIDDEAIRKTTKEAIAKGIYNLPKNNNMFNFSHLEKLGKAKYKK